MQQFKHILLAAFTGFILLSFAGCVSTPQNTKANALDSAAAFNENNSRQTAHVFEHSIDGEAHHMQYLSYLPSSAKRNEPTPLLIFLHGAAQRGVDVSKVPNNGPPMLVNNGKTMPFIIVSPLLPKEEWWGHDKNILLLRALIDEAIRKYPVDRSRIYMTGLSAGGFGTWLMLAKYPDLFAAGIPICGGGYPKDADVLKDIPIWAFHGEMDIVVGIKWSSDMVDAIKDAGGRKIKFTRYPFVGHDAWTRTYNNDAIYEWLLQHRRRDVR